jgi:hypothetical protein
LAESTGFEFTYLRYINATQPRHARLVQFAQDAQAKHGLGVDQFCVHGFVRVDVYRFEGCFVHPLAYRP